GGLQGDRAAEAVRAAADDDHLLGEGLLTGHSAERLSPTRPSKPATLVACRTSAQARSSSCCCWRCCSSEQSVFRRSVALLGAVCASSRTPLPARTTTSAPSYPSARRTHRRPHLRASATPFRKS